jgi:EAL domain-containing protein (putative c-di-GMP-specific phosphodiesterase class I)
VLYFQPKINIKNNQIEGAEALIRWKHPEKGILTPFHFIPYAEKSNIITQIDRYVLKKAFEILKKWQNDNYFKEFVLSINISPNEFRQIDFIDNLKNLLNEYKINPQKLEIEITETISMQDIAYTVNVLNSVKNLGFKIAIDDFGTGYSSLNYLKKLPFDTLKIDQTFIRDLEKDRDDLIITKMIVEIAKVLKKQTVAEGVETKKILEIVKSLGVDIVQGYYFAKPLSEENFKKYVKTFKFLD